MGSSSLPLARVTATRHWPPAEPGRAARPQGAIERADAVADTALLPDFSEKLAITLLWVCVSAMPSLVLAVVGVRLTSSSGFGVDGILLPLSWCACAGLTAPRYARLLGSIAPMVVPPSSDPPLHHLPLVCVRFVEDARAIRADGTDLDCSLRRAWELAEDVDRAPPDVQAFLERAGATLEPIRRLLDDRGRRKGSAAKKQLHEQLLAAVGCFETALCSPKSTAFR